MMMVQADVVAIVGDNVVGRKKESERKGDVGCGGKEFEGGKDESTPL